MFSSNIGPNYAPLLDRSLRNLSDLDFHLSRSLKIECDGVIGLPIYSFLLMFNSSISINVDPLRDIGLGNLSDLLR